MNKTLTVLTVLQAALFLFFSGCSNNDSLFDGIRTGNESQFIVDFDILNDSLTHQMTLKENDKIDVTIEKDKGELDISVVDDNGKSIYRGDNSSPGEFVLEITQSGTYTFSVKGHRAAGFVSFIVH